MTTPTEAFDLRTTKDLAAGLIATDLGGEETIARLDELHARIFAAFGDKPEAIAAKLEELGVKGALPEAFCDGGEIYGSLDDDEDNVLAVALRNVCGAHTACVGADYAVLVWATPDGDEISHESVELPESIIAFMRAYEMDFAYPALYTAPLPQSVIDYVNSPVKGIERLAHTVRGPVRQVDDRELAAPMPDDLVAELGAAGLTADDFGDVVEISRGGQLWALVRGTSDGGGFWLGQYGLRMELGPMHAYQDLQSFPDRDDALRHVIRNVNTPRIVPVKLPDGRWLRGPLTGPTDHKRIADRVLLAAMRAGLTLDQPGESPLSPVDVCRDGKHLAHAGMIRGGTWESTLAGGRVLAEQNLDDILLATIEVLATA